MGTARGSSTLVLVDNGRSRILGDPELRQTLACIRCGACLNVCPVYQRIGGHAYGSTYQGPIGAILTPQLTSPEAAPEHPFASSLCGACYETCPVKIEIPHILLKLRERVQRSRGASGAEAAAGSLGHAVLGLGHELPQPVWIPGQPGSAGPALFRAEGAYAGADSPPSAAGTGTGTCRRCLKRVSGRSSGS